MEKVLQASSNRQGTFYKSQVQALFLLRWHQMPSSGLPPVQDNFEGNSECRSVDDVGNGDVGNDDVGNENGEDGDSVDAVGKD